MCARVSGCSFLEVWRLQSRCWPTQTHAGACTCKNGTSTHWWLYTKAGSPVDVMTATKCKVWTVCCTVNCIWSWNKNMHEDSWCFQDFPGNWYTLQVGLLCVIYIEDHIMVKCQTTLEILRLNCQSHIFKLKPLPPTPHLDRAVHTQVNYLFQNG